MVFYFFEFFWYFFRNFLPRAGCEWNSVQFFFSLFFHLSHPVWAKNTAGKRFFNFLNFFCYFFGKFLPQAEYERNSGLILFLFLSFSAYLILFCLGIMPERGFLIFLLFFSKFSCWCSVWAEFGFFFSLFRPISSRFGYK